MSLSIRAILRFLENEENARQLAKQMSPDQRLRMSKIFKDDRMRCTNCWMKCDATTNGECAECHEIYLRRRSRSCHSTNSTTCYRKRTRCDNFY